MTRLDILKEVAQAIVPRKGKTQEAFLNGMAWADAHQWYSTDIKPGEEQLCIAVLGVDTNEETKVRNVSVGLVTFRDGKFYENNKEVTPDLWMPIPSVEEHIGLKPNREPEPEPEPTEAEIYKEEPEVVIAELSEEEMQMSMEAIEKKSVYEALKRNNGNKKKAAEDLHISLRSLQSKIKKYNIQL